MLNIKNLETRDELLKHRKTIIELYNQISGTNYPNYEIFVMFPPYDIYGLFLDEKLIGMMTLQRLAKPYNKGSVLLVEDVSILKEYQGKGYGKQLIDFAKQYGKNNYCYKVILGCSDKNVLFYEKCGFKKSDNLMRYDLNDNC
jgi:GNAT superfamily N-acetyltransferase